MTCATILPIETATSTVLELPCELGVEECPLGLNLVESFQEFEFQQRTLLLWQRPTPASHRDDGRASREAHT